MGLRPATLTSSSRVPAIFRSQFPTIEYCTETTRNRVCVASSTNRLVANDVLNQLSDYDWLACARPRDRPRHDIGSKGARLAAQLGVRMRAVEVQRRARHIQYLSALLMIDQHAYGRMARGQLR